MAVKGAQAAQAGGTRPQTAQSAAPTCTGAPPCWQTGEGPSLMPLTRLRRLTERTRLTQGGTSEQGTCVGWRRAQAGPIVAVCGPSAGRLVAWSPGRLVAWVRGCCTLDSLATFVSSSVAPHRHTDHTGFKHHGMYHQPTAPTALKEKPRRQGDKETP